VKHNALSGKVIMGLNVIVVCKKCNYLAVGKMVKGVF